MMAPTDDSSRLKASPRTPFSNLTISPVMTPERPWIRAIPSPTSSTRPTSVLVTSDSNCSISRWMTEVISSALNFMRLPFDQAIAKFLEMIADRGVVDAAARLDAQAADQRRVDAQGQHWGRVEQPRQPVAERLP